MPANLENSAVASFHSNPKERSVFIPVPKKGNAKEWSNYHTVALISQASNAQNSPSQASIICEPWTSRCSSWILKRERNQRSNCQHLLDHWKSKRVSEKHLLLFYWLCQSLWLCGSQQTVENSLRDGNARPADLPLEKSVCRSGSNSQNWAWSNRLFPDGKRSTSRLYIVTLLI